MIKPLIYSVLISVICLACSTTSAIEDGEQLYAGVKSISYADYERNDHFLTTREEVEAALAAAPTGALFGSSSLRTPIPWRLWLWNATANSHTMVGRWLNRTFASTPVLMSDVTPAVRAKVSQTILRNNGYFRADVDYEEHTLANPKEGKISYTVRPGHLFTIDTVAYKHFPTDMMTLVDSTKAESMIKTDAPFSVEKLDMERTRLSTLFRNNGYYYYQPAYTSYLADTIASPGEVRLRMLMADSLDSRVYRQWPIARTSVYLYKYGEHATTDSLSRRSLTIHYNGRKPDIRPRELLTNVKLRRRMLFSEEKYKETVNLLAANENFSSIDVRFVPRNDSLDMLINCMFNKPWDISLEGRFTGKTSSRMGPGAELSIVRHNLLRYGEKISFNLLGNIEWQTGGGGRDGSVKVNSYEYGGNVTIEMPRLIIPFHIRRRWYSTPSTLIKASNRVINRGGFFNRHIMSGELTYAVQPSRTTRHIFSPLIMEYSYLNSMTDEFAEILSDNSYLTSTMMDQFIPKMRYTYKYLSPIGTLNPITFEATVSESANLLSLGYMAAGKKWGEREKHFLRNPFAQFVKVEADFTKKWNMGEKSSLVAHLGAGILYSYGNSEDSPYTEQFYVGGANSIRAFTIRAIGPGRYKSEESSSAFFDQTGDLKFVANIEYRPHLFGSLYGAAFLDAGNVWMLKDDGYHGAEAIFRPKHFLNDMALAAGVGIRYDLDFFVIRVDWGIGLHVPYATDQSGYFNIPHLGDAHSIHLAVGYPF